MKPEPIEAVLGFDDGTEETVTIRVVDQGRTSRRLVAGEGCADSSLLNFGAHLLAGGDSDA